MVCILSACNFYRVYLQSGALRCGKENNLKVPVTSNLLILHPIHQFSPVNLYLVD